MLLQSKVSVILLSIFISSGLGAQTLSSLRVDKSEIEVNGEVRVYVEFESSENNWCGFYVDWGDGKDLQSFRIGKKPDISSPVTRSRKYDRPGTYLIKAYGDFVLRGLNSAPKCDGRVTPVTITVFDPALRQLQESQKRADSDWRMSQEKAALELERIRVELAEKELDLKARELELKRKELEQIEKQAEVASPETSKSQVGVKEREETRPEVIDGRDKRNATRESDEQLSRLPKSEKFQGEVSGEFASINKSTPVDDIKKLELNDNKVLNTSGSEKPRKLEKEMPQEDVRLRDDVIKPEIIAIEEKIRKNRATTWTLRMSGNVFGNRECSPVDVVEKGRGKLGEQLWEIRAKCGKSRDEISLHISEISCGHDAPVMHKTETFSASCVVVKAD